MASSSTSRRGLLLAKAQARINVSSSLIENGFYEDAVNRLYYAMFFTAEALLDYHGLRFSRHSAVIAKYGEYFAKTEALDRRFQARLQDAFGLRHAADYETDEQITFSRAIVEELLADAQSFLDAARNWLAQNEPRAS